MTEHRNPIDRAMQRLDHTSLDSDVADIARRALQATRSSASLEGTDDTPAGAYLRSMSVAGFRGIGERADLEVQPGPGLTLVVGRNGSGKSSFADALEFLLTGDAMRWSKRTADWKKGWRNLHAGQDTVIDAEFLVPDEANPVTLHYAWGSSDAIEGGAGWAQPLGRPRTSLAEFGWLDAAESARPFLSYSEVGTMLEQGPSKLYDAMSKILGLDALVIASEELRHDRLARSKAIKAAESELTESVLPRLRESDDPRAQRCAVAFDSPVWDLETVREILGGDIGTGASEDIGLLRATAGVRIASPEHVDLLAADARDAIARRDDLAGTDTQRAAALGDLLKRATKFHDDHDSLDCPVCGSIGVLDEAWHNSAQASIVRLEAEAAEVRSADRRVVEAFASFRDAARPAEGRYDALSVLGVDTERLIAAQDHLNDALGAADGPVMLEQVTATFTAYADALELVKSQAQAEADRRNDAWRPLALELSGWLTRGMQAQEDKDAVADIHKAEKWIRQIAAEIRTERFEPIAAQAQAVWSQLSLNSNVELRDLVLSGTTTTRRLNIDVTVDGVEGVALGVMSQGELHSLALSLFLPRATLDESPFRFVVIDDPVQAMDPSRVDGLARVFADIAQERQVIVFTHDDRLPEAFRRLQLPATILNVTRRPGSIVEVEKSLDPTRQALHDARALALSDGVPEDARRRLVPGFCRTALEAAATAAVQRRRLTRGDSHADVENELSNAHRLTHYLALALFDDKDRGGEVLPRLNEYGRSAGDAFQVCNKGVHQGYPGDLIKLVNDTASLAARIEILQ